MKTLRKKLNNHRKKNCIDDIVDSRYLNCFCYYFYSILWMELHIQYILFFSSVSRDDSETAEYAVYSDGYIRYSNDGIAYHNRNGEVVWDKTYSMQKPQIKTCGEIVAVGDINGSSIYVFNKDGALGNVDTSMTISQIEVAKQGSRCGCA